MSSLFSALLSQIYPYPFPEFISALFLFISISNLGQKLISFIFVVIALYYMNFYMAWSGFLALTTLFAINKIELIIKWMNEKYTNKIILSMLFAVSVISILQLVQPFRSNFIEMFPYVTYGDGLRVSGFKQEPSHLAIIVPLWGYFVFKHFPKLFVLITIILSIIIFAITKSDLALVTSLSLLSSFYLRYFKLSILVVPVMLVSSLLIFFSKEIVDYMYTVMLSWRNVPDYSLVYNFKDFLFIDFNRGNADVNDAVNKALGATSYIDKTYSVFANIIFSLGFVIPAILIMKSTMKLRINSVYIKNINLNFKALLIILVCLFFVPKYEIHYLIYMMVIWRCLYKKTCLSSMPSLKVNN
ncbi:hypothetical protein XMD420_000116 [Marinobacterium sp. xm-d-420]|nr:hypothetical protein [Marinobacterium sp. xm-d-420]